MMVSFLLILFIFIALILLFLQDINDFTEVTSIFEVSEEHRHKYVIDSKNRMMLNGECNIPREFFSAIVASNLKGKKHEWFVLGLCIEGHVRYFYSHKGNNSESVFRVPVNLGVRLAQVSEADLVLVYHNHPNGNLSASDADLITAKFFGMALHNIGVELVEYVCARGNFRRYFIKRVFRDRYGHQILGSFPRFKRLATDIQYYSNTIKRAFSSAVGRNN